MSTIAETVLVCLSVLADSRGDIQTILNQASASAADAGETGYPLLMHIGVCQAKAGERSAAATTFDRCRQGVLRMQDEHAKQWGLAQLAEACAKAGEWDGALRTVREIAHPDTEAYARYLVVAAQAEAGQIRRALATADCINPRATGWKTSALADVAIAEGNAGDFDAAKRTAKSIDVIACNEKDDRASIVANRDYALRNIAVAQAKSRKTKESVSTVEMISKDVCRMQTLREMATIRAEAGDFDGARGALEDALRIAKSVHANDQVCVIARYQAAIGDIAGARQTIGAVAAGPEKGCALLAIAAAQTKAGDQDGATSMFHEGLRLIRAGNMESLGDVLQELSKTLASAGNLKGALEVVGAIPNHLVQACALHFIAVHEFKSGNASRALQIANGIDDPSQKALALLDIAIAQNKRETGAAEAAFQKALQAAGAIGIGGGTDVITFYEIGRAQARAGNVVAAAATFQQARHRAMQYTEESYVAQLLRDIASAQADGGDVEGAFAWATAITSPLQRGNALLGVVLGILRRGGGSGAFPKHSGVPGTRYLIHDTPSRIQ